jgi:hypothetical protein
VVYFAPAPQPALVAHPTRSEPVWRRTKLGWEAIDVWRPRFAAHEPPMHPLVLVSFQIGVSLLALYVVDEKQPVPEGNADRGDRGE